MAEEKTSPFFEFDLGKFGGRIIFSRIDDAVTWATNEWQKWRWLEDQSLEPPMGEYAGAIGQFFREFNAQFSNWQSHQGNQDFLNRCTQTLTNLFQNYYSRSRMLHSEGVQAKFIFELREKYGPSVAAGAYTALSGAGFRVNQPFRSQFFQGVIEGFLFDREIDWTASAHHKILTELEGRYASNISSQNIRLTEIETKNNELNLGFKRELEEKAKQLDDLRTSRTNFFQQLENTHTAKIQDLEETYNRKLALQAPITYWESKEKEHRSGAKLWGAIVTSAFLGLACGMGKMAYEVFGTSQKEEFPPHWQIGMFLVVAFFAVWVCRILVRMFLSHQHLATDAAERKIMILTYLSLSREGSPYAPDDKKLILQHIFREASDGLVKDDAAPKTPLEMGSR